MHPGCVFPQPAIAQAASRPGRCPHRPGHGVPEVFRRWQLLAIGGPVPHIDERVESHPTGLAALPGRTHTGPPAPLWPAKPDSGLFPTALPSLSF